VTTPAPQPVSTLLVIAKQPVPGRVKTRLVPPCTHEQAAALATVLSEAGSVLGVTA
jgi:glycosyltransferase A (GT-A) superfamily protein (DUF2064 family)